MTGVAPESDPKEVLDLVRRLVASGQPFSVRLESAEAAEKQLASLGTSKEFGLLAAGSCKKWIWVLGKGLVCVDPG